MKRSVVALAFATFVSTLAFAHEDDGKILDRKAPYRGEAWRASQPAAGSALAASAFQSSGISLQSWLPLSVFGANQVNGASCFGYTSPSGREYALISLSNGTGFVEVTDPANAQLVGVIPAQGSLWGDVRTYSHYAYAVKESSVGIQVIDLANIDAGQVSLVTTVTNGGSLSTHTIAIDQASGFLYRAGGSSNGLRIYSLANPANPTLVGQWQTRYVHEVTPITYTSGPYAGKQIAFACSGLNGGWTNTGLDVLDVTDKNNIVVMSNKFWPNAGYSHQAWPSEDLKYLFINDELDEGNFNIPTRTIVFDIQNLSNPTYLGSFTNGNLAVGHNLYVKGNLLFEANYTSGLRIFDVTNPLAATEVAWFDTYPNHDLPNFNSLWNVYPYFGSGTIIGSDIEQGLFVWRVAGLPAPTTYCQGKANSQGCVPAITSSGSPSESSAQPFTIGGNNFLNQKFGLLFYGAQAANTPFHGGTLCVKSPITRTSVQNSGGSSSGADCTGTFAFDFNAYLQSGADPALQAATHVRCQYWSRDPNDPAGFFDSLSNALWFSIGL